MGLDLEDALGITLATFAPPVTVGDYADLICSYPWPCDEALRVVYGPTPPNERAPHGCPTGESGGNPSVISSDPSYGLFQINAVHAAKVDGVLSRLLDPATNVAVAYGLWLDQGWGPWSCRP